MRSKCSCDSPTTTATSATITTTYAPRNFDEIANCRYYCRPFAFQVTNLLSSRHRTIMSHGRKANQKELRQSGRCCASCCCGSWCGLVSGVLLVVAAALVVDGEHALWFNLLPRLLMLKPGKGFIYNTWSNPTENIPLLQTFYFFNITNPKEVMEKGANPLVKEVGPFIYRERRPKWDVEFSADGTRCFYRYNRTFEFQANASKPQTTLIWAFDQYLLAILWTFEMLKAQKGVTKVIEALHALRCFFWFTRGHRCQGLVLHSLVLRRDRPYILLRPGMKHPISVLSLSLSSL